MTKNPSDCYTVDMFGDQRPPKGWGMTPGKDARDKGIAQVADNAVDFMEWAQGVALKIYEARGAVTSDDIRKVAERQKVVPHHPNAWGALFKRKGWVRLGYKQSVKISNHARQISIWAWEGER